MKKSYIKIRKKKKKTDDKKPNEIDPSLWCNSC